MSTNTDELEIQNLEKQNSILEATFERLNAKQSELSTQESKLKLETRQYEITIRELEDDIKSKQDAIRNKVLIAEKKAEASEGRGKLLAQIQAGAKLRKVEKGAKKKPQEEGGLLGALMAGLGARRGGVVGEDDEDEKKQKESIQASAGTTDAAKREAKSTESKAFQDKSQVPEMDRKTFLETNQKKLISSIKVIATSNNYFGQLVEKRKALSQAQLIKLRELKDTSGKVNAEYQQLVARKAEEEKQKAEESGPKAEIGATPSAEGVLEPPPAPPIEEGPPEAPPMAPMAPPLEEPVAEKKEAQGAAPKKGKTAEAQIPESEPPKQGAAARMGRKDFEAYAREKAGMGQEKELNSEIIKEIINPKSVLMKQMKEKIPTLYKKIEGLELDEFEAENTLKGKLDFSEKSVIIELYNKIIFDRKNEEEAELKVKSEQQARLEAKEKEREREDRERRAREKEAKFAEETKGSEKILRNLLTDTVFQLINQPPPPAAAVKPEKLLDANEDIDRAENKLKIELKALIDKENAQVSDDIKRRLDVRRPAGIQVRRDTKSSAEETPSPRSGTAIPTSPSSPGASPFQRVFKAPVSSEQKLTREPEPAAMRQPPKQEAKAKEVKEQVQTTAPTPPTPKEQPVTEQPKQKEPAQPETKQKETAQPETRREPSVEAKEPEKRRPSIPAGAGGPRVSPTVIFHPRRRSEEQEGKPQAEQAKPKQGPAAEPTKQPVLEPTKQQPVSDRAKQEPAKQPDVPARPSNIEVKAGIKRTIDDEKQKEMLNKLQDKLNNKIADLNTRINAYIQRIETDLYSDKKQKVLKQKFFKSLRSDQKIKSSIAAYAKLILSTLITDKDKYFTYDSVKKDFVPNVKLIKFLEAELKKQIDLNKKAHGSTIFRGKGELDPLLEDIMKALKEIEGNKLDPTEPSQPSKKHK